MATSSHILDTNILVHLIREDSVGERVKQKYAPLLTDPTPAICIVTEGEMRSLAIQWEWGARKKDRMEFLLGYFWRLPIDTPAMFEAYAVIDAYCAKRGLALGKNDLWIAAAACIAGATIVTTDKDFTHLQPEFLVVDWIDPELETKQPE